MSDDRETRRRRRHDAGFGDVDDDDAVDAGDPPDDELES